jgi:general secretion pathway protein K
MQAESSANIPINILETSGSAVAAARRQAAPQPRPLRSLTVTHLSTVQLQCVLRHRGCRQPTETQPLEFYQQSAAELGLRTVSPDALLAAAQTPPAANAALLPQRFEQLRWLGLSAKSLARLSPHMTVLPTRTPVNLNTASAEVLYASVPGLELQQAQQWTNERASQPFDNLEAVRTRMGQAAVNINDTQHAVNTRYFEVTGKLRHGQVYQLQKSLIQRDGKDSKTIWREQRGLRSEPGCLSTIPPPC